MSPIHEKISIAKNKMKEIEKKFPSEIEVLLKQLKQFIIQADNERILSGMTEICAQCGQEGKSCCGSAIEFKYSDELLLINLLYGIELPENPEIPDMCHFLTSKGCSLFARDTFCINFICDRIKENIPLEKLKKLQEFEGLQLNLQFKLEEMLKKFSNDLQIFQYYKKLKYFCI